MYPLRMVVLANKNWFAGQRITDQPQPQHQGDVIMANLLWLQGGACSGNTMSFLNAEEPSACDLVTDFGINVLWHPSLGVELGDNLQKMLRDCVSRRRCRSISSSSRAPWCNAPERHRRMEPLRRPADEAVGAGSGRRRRLHRWPIGDCATWGGIPATAPNPSDSQRPAISEARPWRIPRRRLTIEVRPAGHQHSRLSGASGLDHADRRGRRHRTRRRPPRSTTSSDRRPSSRASRRPAAPATCISRTRSRPPSSASARAACSTTWAAAGR